MYIGFMIERILINRTKYIGSYQYPIGERGVGLGLKGYRKFLQSNIDKVKEIEPNATNITFLGDSGCMSYDMPEPDDWFLLRVERIKKESIELLNKIDTLAETIKMCDNTIKDLTI